MLSPCLFCAFCLLSPHLLPPSCTMNVKKVRWKGDNKVASQLMEINEKRDERNNYRQDEYKWLSNRNENENDVTAIPTNGKPFRAIKEAENGKSPPQRKTCAKLKSFCVPRWIASQSTREHTPLPRKRSTTGDETRLFPPTLAPSVNTTSGPSVEPEIILIQAFVDGKLALVSREPDIYALFGQVEDADDVISREHPHHLNLDIESKVQVRARPGRNHNTTEPIRKRASAESDALDDVSSVAEGEIYEVPTLLISQGPRLSFLREAMALLLPSQFPVELVRSAFSNQMSVTGLALQLVKLELGFLACLVLVMAVAVAPPLLVLLQSCTAPGSRFVTPCARRASLVSLTIVACLASIGLSGMLVSNDAVSRGVSRAPRVLRAALTDLSIYVKNSQRQFSNVVTVMLDDAVASVSADLDDIENRLGVPIQNDVTVQTGMDEALHALQELSQVTQKVADSVALLLQECRQAQQLRDGARDRLAELRRQVEALRKQCTPRDRALCDTIDASRLDVGLSLEQLLQEPRLGHIKALPPDVVQEARTKFQFIPQHIEAETRNQRTGIKTEMRRRKSELDAALKPLEEFLRTLRTKAEDAAQVVMGSEEGIDEMERWRWLALLAASLVVLTLCLLLLSAVAVGFCYFSEPARIILLLFLLVTSTFSLLLWSVASVLLFFGSHGEVLFCRPLHDEPEFPVLTKVLEEPDKGLAWALAMGNTSLDVSVRHVLQSCKANSPAYTAFRLEQILDLSDYFSWEALQGRFQGLQPNLTRLHVMDPQIQARLQSIVQAAQVNLTGHRTELSRAAASKDLDSVAKHMESVAAHLTDLATASRLTSLASRTRRLQGTTVRDLEASKDEVVFQLTRLEVELAPFQLRVNLTMSQLLASQARVKDQSSRIARQRAEEYASRLGAHFDRQRVGLVGALENHVAPCAPLWDLFSAVRLQFCRHILDPVNGFWISMFSSLVLFVVATPLALNLLQCYKHDRKNLLGSDNGTSGSFPGQEGDWTISGFSQPGAW